MEEESLIRGVNWAPDSDDGEESDEVPFVMDESDEVSFVMDSLAGNTEVPNSQDFTGVSVLEEEMVDVKDVALTLLQLPSDVSKFDSDRLLKKAADLMLPVLVPLLYGEHDERVNHAATTLLWFSHGQGCGHGREAILVHDEASVPYAV
ncbi:unnamed protein product [Urochloa decumbens]|uniref:Uncharacterized protein n=1 Tax=Urochloa decumbens TaxID=240449 RepID=A0ABC9EIX6_9POAL